MSGTLYFDSRSPQARSVLFLIEALGIDIDRKPVDLFKGEQRNPDFLKVERKYFENI